jgi:hypothetical protein
MCGTPAELERVFANCLHLKDVLSLRQPRPRQKVNSVATSNMPAESSSLEFPHTDVMRVVASAQTRKFAQRKCLPAGIIISVLMVVIVYTSAVCARSVNGSSRFSLAYCLAAFPPISIQLGSVNGYRCER